MKIVKVKYLENGYFEVKYSGCDPVIQDMGAIKMQVPTSNHIKDILLFLRKIKIEKITDGDNFDELKYRNFEVVEDESLKRMRQMAQAQSSPKPTTPIDSTLLDALLETR
jgi:hypothetical protein